MNPKPKMLDPKPQPQIRRALIAQYLVSREMEKAYVRLSSAILLQEPSRHYLNIVESIHSGHYLNVMDLT